MVVLWRGSRGNAGSRSGRGRGARGTRDASRRRWSPRGRRARAAAPLPWHLPERPRTRDQRPSHRSPKPRDGSFPPRGGINHRGRVGRSRQRLSRRCTLLPPRGANRCHRAASTHLHAVDATHTRWATPTTASSSARTCCLQRAPPMRKTVLQKTHAAGYVPPRHATPGGQKIMQYEYQEFVNAREAAKKERRPKGAAPVLPPKK